MKVAEIRPACPGEADALARVHAESWRTTYRGLLPAAPYAHAVSGTHSAGERRKVWERILGDPAQIVLVAAEGGTPLGFAHAGSNRGGDDDYAAELYSIYLLAPHQRRGIGARLVAALADRLRGEGLRSMLVWVLRQNPARGFYEKLGGRLLCSRQFVLSGTLLEEVAYGWTDLGALHV